LRMSSASTEGLQQQLHHEAALRRVAVLVGEGAAEDVVLDAVALEASHVIAPAVVRVEQGPPVEPPSTAGDAAGASGHVLRVPITVDGQSWGALVATNLDAAPDASEARLADFGHLAARAMSNVRAREELRTLAEQQGALRRVATLVAQGAGPGRIFNAIAAEASRILGVDAISLTSYDPETEMFRHVSNTHGSRAASPIGSEYPLGTVGLGTVIVEAGKPVRVDDWEELGGEIAARHREEGFGQAVGAPIVVDGSVWGFVGAYGEYGEDLPDGCEDRLADFTSLMGMAIANVEARDELRDLAESQSALRRIATLVAEGAEPQAVFETVALEASRMLKVAAVSLLRHDAATEMFTKLYGTHGDRSAVPDGASWPVRDIPDGAMTLEAGKPVRIDDWSGIPGEVAARHIAQGFGQAVSAPIVLDGEIWGVISAFGEADETLPPGSEARLADYTNLMASAIANAEARDELRGLAEQQGAALRRVATLVAEQASPGAIFDAVALEASRALRVPRVAVAQCQTDGSLALLGSTGPMSEPLDAGSNVVGRLTGGGRSARVDNWTPPAGSVTGAGLGNEFPSIVGAPIVVEGSLWGVIVVLGDELLPPDTETRLTDFTHLVAGSIANVNARNNLVASRARIVAASDDTRRRIERNLHDGIQQRIVGVALGLRAVRTSYPSALDMRDGIDGVARDLDGALEEIRTFSQGLHPALLSRSGIGPSVRALARRSPIPVNLEIDVSRRVAEAIEIATYYVVSEALANVAKHAHASEASVTVRCTQAAVSATITDDGLGGAELAGGSGLVGLVDRVEALGGSFNLSSPAGIGTTISVNLPLEQPANPEDPEVPSAV
jgi:signal transduction histidine kinase